MKTNASQARVAIRRYMIAAGGIIAIFGLGMGGWAMTAELAGAVIASGTVVVDGHVKKVQHRDGGIVAKINVRNGSPVAAGELLIRLDDTQTRANLAIITKQIDQLQASRMRLAAERDNHPDLKTPTELLDRVGNPDVAENITAEKTLFLARQQTIAGQKAQLRERVSQIAQESDGLTVRRDAKVEELRWISEELLRIQRLSDQGLVQFSRLSELQRLKAQLDGERGQLIAEIARSKTQITETELQVLQLDQDRRTEVLTDLRDVDSKLAELSEQKIAAEDQLNRIDIAAPQAGIVHELTVHTIGGVISGGETIMQIVPVNDRLVVDVKIMPADIDQIHVGQIAMLRLSAFSQRTTPELQGSISTIAADLSQNPQTGETWYAARIVIPANEIDRLSNLILLAGMPVEAFIKTGDRTAFSYLVKPFMDQVAKAMRED